MLNAMNEVHPLHGTAIGHLVLIANDSPLECPDDCVALDLRPMLDQLHHFQVDGTLLSLRLLVPLVPMPAAALKTMDLIVSGVGAEFAAHCAKQVGMKRVVLHDASTATASPTSASSGGADDGFQRAYFGCGGKVPSVEALLPVLEQLRPDGHFGLFGLPSAQLAAVQNILSDCGFSMRSAGVDEEFSFLSGSMESLKRLRGKGALV
jgi:hypothetical protein